MLDVLQSPPNVMPSAGICGFRNIVFIVGIRWSVVRWNTICRIDIITGRRTVGVRTSFVYKNIWNRIELTASMVMMVLMLMVRKVLYSCWYIGLLDVPIVVFWHLLVLAASFVVVLVVVIDLIVATLIIVAAKLLSAGMMFVLVFVVSVCETCDSALLKLTKKLQIEKKNQLLLNFFIKHN